MRTIMTTTQGTLFIISAPSGGGKTTLVYEVIKRLAATIPLCKVITYTTRAPRPNEHNGDDYYFVTNEEFLAKKEHNFFIETTLYDTNWYGSPRSVLDGLTQGTS